MPLAAAFGVAGLCVRVGCVSARRRSSGPRWSASARSTPGSARSSRSSTRACTRWSEIDKRGGDAVVEEAIEFVSGAAFVHVSLDMDAVDPMFACWRGPPRAPTRPAAPSRAPRPSPRSPCARRRRSPRISDRPDPTSPASPTTSPARTVNETSANSPRRGQAVDLQHDVATGRRAPVGEHVLDGRGRSSTRSSSAVVRLRGREVATARCARP